MDLTRSALFSLMKADIPEDTEVIIIDDGSPYGAGVLKENATTYIYHAKNQGFMKSVNDGLRVARGDLIAVCNNDIKVAPNFYSVAEKILRENPSAYSVHPRMCFYDEPIRYGDSVFATGRERWCQTSFFIIDARKGKFFFPEHFDGTGGAYDDVYYWCDIRDKGLLTAYTTQTAFQHKDSSTTQLLGEESKHHKENKEIFKARFGEYPDEYLIKLYPEQFRLNWREEFTKI